jgi:transketolase
MQRKRFSFSELPTQEIEKLSHLTQLCRRDILTMTSLASSGHPGGSMSALGMFLTVYSYANISPENLEDPHRDKTVVSFGHTSPGIYSVLGRLGFFDIESAIATFRKSGSIFEGHVVQKVPGVDWGTGNLGQGLSAGCGFALVDKIQGRDSTTFVLMSDGEQTKGQVGEARRFAKKYHLNQLKVLIDYNQIQISGSIHDIMPQNIRGNFLADGWEVLEVDGHDYAKLYAATKKAVETDAPVCILCHTTMAKGVSFMEGKAAYHGKPLKTEELAEAVKELGLENLFDSFKEMREKKLFSFPHRSLEPTAKLNPGSPRTYLPDEKIDNRSAYGNALTDLGKVNSSNGKNPLLVFDCDLATSVKTDKFWKEFPSHFYQVGVQEHNAATIAGASSYQGAVSFFSDFGVFGVDEVYNQQRLNDLNYTNLKVVCTHVGLDVGEDGKTHQCIDYLGLFRNLFNFKVIIPGDANQTDRAIRFAAANPGNVFIGMGRSIAPIVTNESGEPFFGEGYTFTYGKADIVRKGTQGYLYTMGTMLPRAVKISESLKKRGISIGVINCASPLVPDPDALSLGIEAGMIVSLEDHNADTGLGSTIALHLAEKGIGGISFFRLGIRKYGSSGTPDSLFAEQGISAEDVEQFIQSKLS